MTDFASTRLRSVFASFVLALVLTSLGGCGDSEAEKLAQRQREAIKRVLEMDKAYESNRGVTGGRGGDFDRFAAAAQKYVEVLAATDMSDLPPDVRDAYSQHVRAWQEMVVYLNGYTGVTGSLKRGWDGDAARFRSEILLKAIKDTWDSVKNKAASHGVDMTPYK